MFDPSKAVVTFVPIGTYIPSRSSPVPPRSRNVVGILIALPGSTVTLIVCELPGPIDMSSCPVAML
uniref:Uncharacterized protein n=1 Tax=uncultured marine virus TaxID=186617 RepID=A0A0F7L5Q2_9VIRU|nr:hypothetical protein [uncultured marine virus]